MLDFKKLKDNVNLDDILDNAKQFKEDQLNEWVQDLKGLFDKGISFEKVCELCKHIPKETIDDVYKKWQAMQENKK